jgi:hypothetical protein
MDPSWEATIGLVGVFFVLFPLLAHVLIGFAVAQVLGERAENQAQVRGEKVGPSQG